jgi:hypothetical protein
LRRIVFGCLTFSTAYFCKVECLVAVASFPAAVHEGVEHCDQWQTCTLLEKIFEVLGLLYLLRVWTKPLVGNVCLPMCI